MNRIDRLFEQTRREGRLAFLPYLTLGYPEPHSIEELARAAVAGGADGMELGVPFSDPIADGRAIQRSTAQALRNGFTVARSLQALRHVRQIVDVPLLPMGYYNPFLQYGLERFCDEAAESGADGIIVPDLPLDEAAEFVSVAHAHDLRPILFVAPTSTERRLEQVGKLASGFVYCVSLRGVTGARASMAADVGEFLARVRRHVHVPIVVGFGISKPEHVAELLGQADGVIVGSAIVDLLDTASPAEQAPALEGYVRSLSAAGRGR